MNFLKRLVGFIYAIMMIAVGASLILLAFNVISPTDITDFLETEIYAPITVQWIVGLIGMIILIIGIMIPKKMGKKIKKDRVITFQNPDGEVAVSLSAIEDYIKKLAKGLPGVKDIKSHVDADKKGISVTIAVGLAAGVNIPEITEHIQMEVRSTVQAMIGVEEKISVVMHITKIEGGMPPEMAPQEEAQEPEVPFGRDVE